MKIDFNKSGDVLTINLEGRLDTTTAPELDRFIGENCGFVNELIIDCEKLSYISSAGLRVLLVAHKKMKGGMKLTRVCELVMEVFDITGFTDILNIEE